LAAALGITLARDAIFTPAMGNLDFDPRLEVIAITDSSAVYAWDDDGVPFAGADSTGLILALPPQDPPAQAAIPADLTGDAQDELFVVTRACSLRAYSFASGVLQPFVRSALPSFGGGRFRRDVRPALAFGDLGDDGLREGVVSFVDGDTLHVQSFDGERRRTLRRAIAALSRTRDEARVLGSRRSRSIAGQQRSRDRGRNRSRIRHRRSIAKGPCCPVGLCPYRR
jgi:hypothetical protein